MAYKVVYSALARQDVEEAAAYIAARSPRAARKWLRELFKLQTSLATFPFQFPAMQNIPNIEKTYRTATHYSHRIFFRVDEPLETITIVRVYHSARRPLQTLPDEED